MRLETISGDDPREMLRALRAAVLGSGPAISLGMPAGAVDAAGNPVALEVPSGTAVVVTTSGSSGVPKSVMLSRSALTSSALSTAARIGEGAWLLALPASYVAGLQVLVRSLVQGHEPAILSGKFSAEAFTATALGMVSSVGGTRVPSYTSLVPAQLGTLLDAAPHDSAVAQALRSFEAILIGGQALPAAMAARADEFGVNVVRTYGSSETAGGCVYDGVPLDGVRVREVDGELQLGGPTLADGYLGNPELTAEVFVHEGGERWYRTGDAGSFVDGVVRVTGRRDNVIISGGVNVSLDRVEAAVHTVPGLERAVVVGVPDERWGEASTIALGASSSPAGSPVDAATLLEAARAAVAVAVGTPARPARIEVLPQLPMLSSGKPDRQALRRLFSA